MKSKLFSFKSLCCMAIALSALVLIGGAFSPARADWGAVGTGTDSYVMSLAADKSGNLYAGGAFSTAGSVNVNRIAKWNGSSWSALESGMYSGSEVQSLVFDSSGNMYAGGFFFSVGAVAGLNSIAKWNGSTWSALDSGVFSNMGGGIVKKLAVDKSDNLYAAGVFDHTGGVTVNGIAKWNGSAWSALGSGMGGGVYALAVDSSGNVYAAEPSGGIAKWNGSAWSALGSGANGIVYALAADSSGNVYAGGEFTTAGGVAVSNIAKWNGSTWSALGSGMNGAVSSLEFDSSGNLYAAGGSNVAKWNGSAWSTVGSGMAGVISLAFDSSGNLYAGGSFTTAGGLPANNIAKYSTSNIISGYVRDSGNIGISGVTMTFSDGSTVVTDNSGFYTKTVSSNWSGTVTPSKSSYSFTPSNRSYSNVTTNQLNQDYSGILISTYTVTFQAGTGGTIAPATSQTVASGGSTTAVTATANSGYAFINWTNQSGSVVSTSATLPAQTITSSMTFTANFQQAATRIINLTGSVDFGNVNVGSTKQLNLTISNSGNSTLTVSSITYPAGFTGNWTGGTIAASASKIVTVTFTPTAVQSYSGMLAVNSDKTSGTNTIAISGTGTSVTRIINLTGSLAFGNVNIGATKQLNLTISNSGTSTLTVSSITYPTGFTGNWTGGTIAASGSKIVTVTFKPTAAQSYSGMVTVSSDKTSGTNTITISGTGVAVTKIIGLSGSLAFGNVNIGSTATKTFTISNTGNTTLTVSSITYPTGYTGSWSSGTIAAGSSKSVTVTFKPTAVQTYSGTVTVNSDKTSGTNTIAISGAGIQAALSYTISGYVKNAGSVGISGVTLTFSNSGGTATTDTSGYYSKAFTAAWTGVVTPSKSGSAFTPATRSYSGVTANQTNQNYTGGVATTSFRIWIDKNVNGVYDAGEEVVGASVRVNSETTDRGVTNSQGIISIPNIANDAKIYAQKTLYSMNNPKAGDANFASTRSKNPYYAGTVNGKMYEFVMASDIMAADGSYADFPGLGKTLLNATKDTQGNMLIRLVHPKIGWNLVVSFEEAQSTAFYDQIKAGFKSYADYMYNYTDGYFVVKNVVLVKGAYLNSAQWKYSDVQVKNSEWPNAHVFGNRYNAQTRISMSKSWSGATPDGYNWYSTLGHESGHYLLGFYDEYLNGSKQSYQTNGTGTWTYRVAHDGGTGETNEFPNNYGIMQYQYNLHEMSDATDYYPHSYSSAATVSNQTYLRQGQSCWTYFKSYYQNDIKTQMAANGLTGFSDAFFSNLIVPPHSSGSYPGSDRTKRNGPSVMNRDTVSFIEWNLPAARSTRQNQNVFDADAVVLDETGTPVSGADVWLVSSDRRSFQGKTDKKGIVKCGSLLIGKHLEAYLSGRKAEIMIDAVRERYVLIFPVNRIDLREDIASGIIITAKPDSSNPNRLTITASGSLLSAAPSVTLSQSHNYSVNVSMTASGANEYSGFADYQSDSGDLKIALAGSESSGQFGIFTTDVGPASGYYIPGGELEMAYEPTSFSGSGSFVIMSSSVPVPPNNGLIQIGNVYSFGFSDTVGAVKNVILNIRLSGHDKGANLNLYGWDIQNKTWMLIQGGSLDKKQFSISLASVDYPAYSLFTIPQANDSEPPNPVTGFTASTGTSLWSVNLQLTAPSDNTGVSDYDIRFNTVPVTDDNWDKCISAGNVPKPASPGTLQSFTAEMPDPGTEYYFGIIAIDAAGNSSSLTTSSLPIKSQAADTDGDGIPDSWAISRGLDPNISAAQNDDDGDGLTNLQEYQNHTDPQHSDTDRDGYSDGDEIAQGIDPNDFGSNPGSSSSVLADVIMALRVLAGITDLNVVIADLNGDGKIGLEEVIYILQKAAGLR